MCATREKDCVVDMKHYCAGRAPAEVREVVRDPLLSIYRAAGVRLFQRVAVARQRSFGGQYSGSICIPPPFSRHSLGTWEAATRENETAHLLWLVVSAPVCVACVAISATFAVPAVLGQLFLTVYPIMLQHYNRRRLHHAKGRLNAVRAVRHRN
jgi:Glycosyl-4,4'-diaponeurosporenoate acyltransferase